MKRLLRWLEKDLPITKISRELDVARNTLYRIRDENKINI